MNVTVFPAGQRMRRYCTPARGRVCFVKMTTPLALKCPSCASALRAEDFDSAQGIVTCSYCNALMTLPGRTADSAAGPRPRMPLPDRVSLKETMHGIEIQRRWFTPVALFLVFFCIVWDGFLLFWYTAAMAGPGTPWAVKMLPLVHVAVGVAVTYTTLATLINTTRVLVDRGQVEVSHGPIPWLGNVTMQAAKLDQLFCKEKITRGKNGPHYSYEVWTALQDGSAKKLVAAGLDKEQAIFIEQEIEHALGIKDRAVAGEMSRI